MNLIATASGRMVDPFAMHFDDLHIEDIAHALSNICRFTGHVSRFMSVAEHSVHCSRLVPPGSALLALLHDASEAYLGDIASPTKRRPEFVGYRDAELRLQRLIIRRFTTDTCLDEHVFAADAAMLHCEAIALMPNSGWADRKLAADVELKCWAPIRARREFLLRYEELAVASPALAVA